MQLVADAVMLMGSGQINIGGTESRTVIRVKHAAMFPAVSTAVKPTLSVPCPKKLPLGNPDDWKITSSMQLSVAVAGEKLTFAPH